MDNQGWMPVHVESSRLESDNLRLMQSMPNPRCILMGSVRMPEQGRGTQGSVVSTPVAIKQPGGRRSGFLPRNSMRVMITMMLLMLAGLPECVAFCAYDCNSQSSQIEQYSLLDPEPCGNMEKVHEWFFLRIFEKIRNGPNGIIRGLGETESRKKPESKNLVTLSL